MIQKFLLPLLPLLLSVAHAQPLCPGAPMASTVLYPVRNLMQQNVAATHRLGMIGAQVVYGLADLDRHRIFSDKGIATGPQMIAAYRAFLPTIPAGYKIFRAFAEHEYGLKYMVLRPADNPAAPWIFAIAGTQTTLDWIIDVDLGRSQFEKLTPLFEMFTTCNQMAPDKTPMAAHEFIFSGHSLGGGLAQAFAYKIQAQRLRAGLRPLAMQVATFNAFGAKPLIEKTETFQPGVAALMNATNFFVKEDLVSRIGTHIGVTKQLTPPGDDPATNLGLRDIKELVNRHAMETVIELSAQMPYAPVITPPGHLLLNKLSKLGGAALFIAHVLPRRFEAQRVVKVVQDAADELIGGGFKDPADQQVRELLIAFVQARIREMDKPSNGILANYALEDMRKILMRLNLSRPITIR